MPIRHFVVEYPFDNQSTLTKRSWLGDLSAKVQKSVDDICPSRLIAALIFDSDAMFFGVVLNAQPERRKCSRNVDVPVTEMATQPAIDAWEAANVLTNGQIRAAASPAVIPHDNDTSNRTGCRQRELAAGSIHSIDRRLLHNGSLLRYLPTNICSILRQAQLSCSQFG